MTDLKVCTCGPGDACSNCDTTDEPEVEVIARALAEWSSPQYEWGQRHPNNRAHWLKLARTAYAAMSASRDFDRAVNRCARAIPAGYLAVASDPTDHARKVARFVLEEAFQGA